MKENLLPVCLISDVMLRPLAEERPFFQSFWFSLQIKLWLQWVEDVGGVL